MTGMVITRNTFFWATGGTISFFLFVLMAKLISQPYQNATQDPPVVIDNILYEEHHLETRIKQALPPKPEIQSPPPPKIPVHEPTDSKLNPGLLAGFEPYTTNTEITLSESAVFSDANPTPIFRASPDYPGKATLDGTEGWVKLQFTVTANGNVTDVKVLDSQPKRIFDASAKQALLRWKYKPKVVDGIFTDQPGMVVVLEFTLS